MPAFLPLDVRAYASAPEFLWTLVCGIAFFIAVMRAKDTWETYRDVAIAEKVPGHAARYRLARWRLRDELIRVTALLCFFVVGLYSMTQPNILMTSQTEWAAFFGICCVVAPLLIYGDVQAKRDHEWLLTHPDILSLSSYLRQQEKEQA